MGLHGDALAVEVLDQQVTGAIAAVADGKAFTGRYQPAAGQTPPDGGSCLVGGEAVLESVRSDQDVHAFDDVVTVYGQ